MSYRLLCILHVKIDKQCQFVRFNKTESISLKHKTIVIIYIIKIKIIVIN